jgi:hypothetical protein
MNVEINNQKYRIKPASELTVNEYIKFFSIISVEPKEKEVIICYLAAITGLDFKEINSVSMDSHSLRRLSVYIGPIHWIDKIENCHYFYYRKTAKRIYKENLNWRTLGVRRMIEDRQASNQLELAVYLLAIYIDGKYDQESIEEIYNDLLNYNAISVYSFIIFFFTNLMNGKISVLSSIRLQAIRALINIRTKLKR